LAFRAIPLPPLIGADVPPPQRNSNWGELIQAKKDEHNQSNSFTRSFHSFETKFIPAKATWLARLANSSWLVVE